MPLPRREDPIQTLLNFARTRRVEYAEKLTVGSWQGEAEGKKLCGYIQALDDLESEIMRITAPGAHFAEKDL